MTEAMPFLQKAILLSYDPRPLRRVRLPVWGLLFLRKPGKMHSSVGRSRAAAERNGI